MFHAGHRRLQSQREIQRRPRPVEGNMILLEGVSLNPLPECDDRLYIPDPAGGHPYNTRDRPSQDCQRQEERYRQKTDLIRNACL